MGKFCFRSLSTSRRYATSSVETGERDEAEALDAGKRAAPLVALDAGKRAAPLVALDAGERAAPLVALVRHSPYCQRRSMPSLSATGITNA